MLVLSRLVHESIVITVPDGVRMTITIAEVRGDKVRLGIEAPKEYRVHRKEVQDKIDMDSE